MAAVEQGVRTAPFRNVLGNMAFKHGKPLGKIIQILLRLSGIAEQVVKISGSRGQGREKKKGKQEKIWQKRFFCFQKRFPEAKEMAEKRL